MARKQAKNTKPSKSQALVVYQSQPKPAKKKRNKPKHSVVRNDVSAAATYRAALSDPFSFASQGARVPDMYCVPTITRHITKSFTIKTNASGEFDVVILPSAFYHCISSRSSLAGGSIWSLADGTTFAESLQYTDPVALQQQLANYRIVGYGVKVLGMSSLTSTAGKVMAATIPISSWINSKDKVGGQVGNTNNSQASIGNTFVSYGIPTQSSLVNIPAVPNLPNSMETSAVRLTENPLTIIPKISSPEAFNFRLSADSAVGYNITDQTSASFVYAGDASYLRLGGFEAVLLVGSSMANSSNVMEIEVVYHLEGTPYQSTTTGIGGDSAAAVVAPSTWMNIVQAVAKMPAFKEVVTTTGNSFIPGLGTLANRFL